MSIEHAFGIADQPPNFVPGVPGVAVAGLPGGLQRSVQTSAGDEIFVRRDSTVLTGAGTIGLGRVAQPGTALAIHYVVEE